MRNRYYLLALLGLFISVAAAAQEAIFELGGNTVLMNAWKQKEKQDQSRRAAMAPLQLPFFDDFAYDGPYPDSTKWIGNSAYVNYTFPKAPPSLGVATLDGLAPNGLPYDWNVTSGSSRPADTLTSQVIDLSMVPPADTTVYFSFFYQPQGRGNAPEEADSLVLEFRQQVGEWTRMWSKAGYAPSLNDSTFHFVNIRVDNEFFHNAFQFRFRSWATISGNTDHWHIDYVYLNKSRKPDETGELLDYGFAYQAPSLLRSYQSMPYRQYTRSELKDNLSMFIRNNSGNVQSVKYSYRILDKTNGTTLFTHSGGTANINAYPGYHSWASHATPPVPVTDFPEVLDDSAYYEVVHALDSLPSSIARKNDTTRFHQKFYNYYAYDDGTAELAYGISSAFALIAYKFSLNTPDTLRAVAIHWNPFLKSMETKGIRITVWDDIGGKPGNIIYQDSVKYPKYVAGHNNFYYYMVDDQEVKVQGTFYIGWVQLEAETLNVGFDANNNVQSKIYYNTNGNWNTSAYRGALMMRPYLGGPFVPVGIPQQEGPKPVKQAFSIYPNPAQDKVYVRDLSHEQKGAAAVNIFDAYGRLVISGRSAGEIDVSALSAGMYIVNITGAQGTVSTHRLIISR